jgi:hypothetical protein
MTGNTVLSPNEIVERMKLEINKLTSTSDLISTIDALEKLSRLYESKVIAKEEYEKMKSKLKI